MNLKRLVLWLVVGLMVLYVIKFPQHAADLARTAGGGLAAVGSSLVSFVGSLV